MKRALVCLLSIIFSLLLSSCVNQTTHSPEQQQKQERLVLTSLAPVYQLTLALTEDTDISVKNIPERPRSMASQPTFFARQGENFAESFKKANAVISIGKVWNEDPLYTTARQFNIRIVNIDAAQPWSYERSGVALARSPVNNEVSPYFWTSPGNAIRMLENMAWDLTALFPDQSVQIDNNLQVLKSDLLDLKSKAESRLLNEVDDPVVYALTDEFINLTNELGLFVDGYFVKQDIDWTEDDLKTLTQHLKNNGIKVVIHKWEPSPEIQNAIKNGEASLVVLDTIELTNNLTLNIYQSNLDSIINSFGN